MQRITLYEEFKLIEKNDSEVYGIWKGAHLLLFFLAFVFGSFCTFCFHMLMYLFDEKCVLFPKLLSLTSLRQNIIYEFIPEDKERANMLPVDFLGTQWVEKSDCYLPTYVPLISGIFGLVWTTMFLMCSSGSRVLTGLQRPWRILPPVFVFSVAMGSLCVYTSVVTHYGLQDLCLKLSEITGSTTCTYSVNVATLAYERRIRGVYQATRLTILSAWLHTGCWLVSALLTVMRVLLAVDFQLVRVSAHLKGDIDRFLEEKERHIRTISPGLSPMSSEISFKSGSIKVHFKKKNFRSNLYPLMDVPSASEEGKLLYLSNISTVRSEPSLVKAEKYKLSLTSAYSTTAKEHWFIVKLVYDLLNKASKVATHAVAVTEGLSDSSLTLSEGRSIESAFLYLSRQYAREDMTSLIDMRAKFDMSDSKKETGFSSGIVSDESKTGALAGDKSSVPGTSKPKSSMKHTATQTHTAKQRVHIDSKTSVMLETSDAAVVLNKNVEKETQTPKKEKQE